MNRIINVKVIAGARKEEIVGNILGESFKIKLTTPPVDGKANKKLIEILSEFFKVNKSQIKIIQGEHSNKKVIEIEN